MEKNHWNVMLGDKMLEAYSEILPLGEREMEYLAISLSYPEKVLEGGKLLLSVQQSVDSDEEC